MGNKLVLLILALLLVFPLVSAKDFIIQNATNSAVNYFVVNGTTGRVGVGTGTPTQAFDVIGYARGSTGLCIGADCRTAWPAGGSGGIGTITQIDTNNGITGGPITTSGTIGLTGQALALHNLGTNGIIVRTGAGTVTARSVVAGVGISVTNGDGVAGNPTIALNNTGVSAGSYGSNINVGTFTVDAQGRLTAASNTAIRTATTGQTGIVQLTDSISSTSTTTAATPNSVKTAYDLAATKVGGTGTTNTLAKFTAAGTIGNSNIADTGSLITLTGNSRVTGNLQLDGDLFLTTGDVYLSSATAINGTFLPNIGSTFDLGSTGARWRDLWLSGTLQSGTVPFARLPALTTNRALVSDGSGVIGVSTVTSTELGYVSGVTSAIQTQLNAKAGVANCPAGQVVQNTTSGGVQCVSLSTGNIQGGGTANYIPMYNGSGTVLGNSNIRMNGANVGIGSSPATEALTVTGNIKHAASNNWVGYDLGNAYYPFVGGGYSLLQSSGDIRISPIDNIILNPAIGNVGIGTLNPLTKLDINGTIKIGYDTVCSAGYGGTLRYNGTGLQLCNGTNWTSIGTGGSGYFNPPGIVLNSTNQVRVDRYLNARGLCIEGVCIDTWTQIAGTLVEAAGTWQKNGNKLYYNTDNVGIGTNDPTYPLQVVGDVAFSGTLQSGTVPWARLSGQPSVSAGTGLSGGGALTGSVTLNLANTAVTSGSYGSNVNVPTFTVDAQGRLIAASNTAIRTATTGQTGIVQLTDSISTTSSTVAATATAVKAAYDLAASKGTGSVTSIATNNGVTGGTITTTGTIGLTGQALALHNLGTNGIIVRTGAGTVTARSVAAGTGLSVSNGDGVAGNPTVTLANTAVSAGSYGSASSVGTFTVDAQGRLTAAGSSSIAIAGTQITSGTIDAARIPNLDTSKLTTGTLPVNRGGTGTGTSTGTGNVVLSASPTFTGTITAATLTASTVNSAAFWYTSDETLKENIISLQSHESLSKVMKLNPVSFEWKEKTDSDKRGLQIGLIAQEVEKIYPELVHTNDEGIKSVQYANLVAPLIATVQDQEKRIQELEERLAKLESR